MEFRTEVKPPLSDRHITYETPVMFIGSCFANEMGYRLASGKMNVMTNPHGTLFNPFSVAAALERFAAGYSYSVNDVYQHQNRYLSLNHHTAFSSYDRDVLIERLNQTSSAASLFVRKASFLFVTFGTSYVFTLNESSEIVANCHKLPSSLFTRRQADHTEISGRWRKTLDMLSSVNPGLKVWLTVSPVRHISDGAHANQVSKSHLLIAVDELLAHPLVAGYFPAYEMFMDDLRDYRFYAPDMAHPSETGVDYIWEKFAAAFIDSPSMRLWSEAARIAKAIVHRPTGTKEDIASFASSMLDKISDLKKRAPFLNLSTEEDYFRNMTI